MPLTVVVVTLGCYMYDHFHKFLQQCYSKHWSGASLEVIGMGSHSAQGAINHTIGIDIISLIHD